MALLPEMEGVLNTMASRPLAERLGAIDGVMVKSFKKWTDQRGYFIEQLKRGDLDDDGRPFLPDQQFAQMSRSLAYARGGNPPELIKAFHWHKRQWDYWGRHPGRCPGRAGRSSPGFADRWARPDVDAR